MQTFLPYPDFAASARVLDRLRLGKQRVECLQILRTLTGQSNGWRNHPAVRMWRGFEIDLTIYGAHICRQWAERGYLNGPSMDVFALCTAQHSTPPWITPALCASHRSNLLRKAPEHYSQFGWTERDDLEYVWPI